MAVDLKSGKKLVRKSELVGLEVVAEYRARRGEVRSGYGSGQMFLRSFLPVLFLVLMGGTASGKERAPLREEDYLGSPVGARPISLGGALAGLAGDGSSLYWNPAGLNLLPVNLVAITFGSEPTKGIGQLFSPSLRRRGLSSLSVSTREMALGWQALSRIAFQDSLHFEVDEGETNQVLRDLEFLADEYLVSVTTMAHGQGLASEESFLMGVNLRYIRGELGVAEKVGQGGDWRELRVNLDRSNGYGVDAGILVGMERFRLGLAVQNAMAKIYWQDYEPERVRAKVMGGFSILPTDWLTLIGAVDQSWYRKSSTVVRLGCEATLWREGASRWYGMFTSFSPSIRLGIYGPKLSRTEGRVLTGGLGYLYSRCKVDTAVYGSHTDNLGYVVTLSIPF